MSDLYYRCMFHKQSLQNTGREDLFTKDTIACASQSEAAQKGWRFLSSYPICPACIADGRYKIAYLEASLAEALEAEHYAFWPRAVARKKLAKVDARWAELCEAA